MDHLSHPSSPTHPPVPNFTPPAESEQEHLLLVFAPSCCSTSPTKTLPELLVRPHQFLFIKESKVVLVVKNLSVNAGDLRDVGSIPGWERSPREGHGNPLQYSCLENPMDRGTWWATVHRVSKSQTRLKGLRAPRKGQGNALQYSCLENPMDRGAWWATVHRVSKSQTRLKGLSMHSKSPRT